MFYAQIWLLWPKSSSSYQNILWIGTPKFVEFHLIHHEIPQPSPHQCTSHVLHKSYACAKELYWVENTHLKMFPHNPINLWICYPFCFNGFYFFFLATFSVHFVSCLVKYFIATDVKSCPYYINVSWNYMIVNLPRKLNHFAIQYLCYYGTLIIKIYVTFRRWCNVTSFYVIKFWSSFNSQSNNPTKNNFSLSNHLW